MPHYTLSVTSHADSSHQSHIDAPYTISHEGIEKYGYHFWESIFRFSNFFEVCTVYPKKYAHVFCFAVLCCGYTMIDFPISIRLTSLALWQSNDCPRASKATLTNMDKYFMWIHYERLHNHNKTKHNKTVCIFLGIYCNWWSNWQWISIGSDNSIVVNRLQAITFINGGPIYWHIYMQYSSLMQYALTCLIMVSESILYNLVAPLRYHIFTTTHKTWKKPVCNLTIYVYPFC